MHILILLNIIFLCLQVNLSAVYAKCCLSDAGGDCGDNSSGSPCCGYNKCNGFCCACPGVTVIREVVDLDSTTFTSVITAPAGTIWTCRASHITTWVFPPPSASSKRDAVEPRVLSATTTTAAIDRTPMPTLTTVTTNVPDYRKMSPHFDGMFTDLSQGLEVNGANVISKEQYLGYFGLSNAQAGTQRGQNVLRKFQMHDRNGDGYLTPDEMSLLCDEDGCDEA
ncbi:hypothetical protein LTR96_003544 [Exophiala xenobiotica]|nr:hypothetical protein LTR96_003544 [Exophiala xenobiotica]KAK5342952.1 hypothetical protein LTR98_000580 [Exophiala xenobiotica]